MKNQIRRRPAMLVAVTALILCYQGCSNSFQSDGASVSAQSNPKILASSSPTPVLNAAVKLTSVLSGQCLNVAGSSSTNGAQIIQWACDGDSNENFTVFEDSNGRLGVKVNLDSLCLNIAGDSNSTGADLIQWTCDNDTNEEFTFTPVSGKENTFTLKALNSSRCLDVQDSTSGKSVVQNPCGTSTSQQFIISTPTPPPTRNPLQQPFASDSIWNMPIGTGAIYVNPGFPTEFANCNGTWGIQTGAAATKCDVPSGSSSGSWTGFGADPNVIILTPTAPLTPIYHSSAGWSGADRCSATSPLELLATLPIPKDFVVPNTGSDNATAILAADGRTIYQNQPLARCTAGGYATTLLNYPSVDLYGPGIVGAQGGSGLSSIGGALRLGELRPANGLIGPRHVLKVDFWNEAFLHTCTSGGVGQPGSCGRWPAWGGELNDVYGGVIIQSNPAIGYVKHSPPVGMKMGALLAIPADVSIDSLGLQTQPGKQLAWTLQNYGVYIVDTIGANGFYLAAELGPNGAFTEQFQSDYGFAFNTRQGGPGGPFKAPTPWGHDILTLMHALQLVDNNGPNSIGGGGTPRQPLAPPITAP